MLAISLTNEQLEKVKLLLHDIKLLQKQSKLFDNEAIEILSFDIIEHLNKREDFPQQEISDEDIEKANYTFKQNDTYFIADKESFFAGAKWYREQLKQRQ
jgi:hypothetical protein